MDQDDGKPLALDEYVFVRNEPYDEIYPWMAKIKAVLNCRQIEVWWLYFPHTAG